MDNVSPNPQYVYPSVARDKKGFWRYANYWDYAMNAPLDGLLPERHGPTLLRTFNLAGDAAHALLDCPITWVPELGVGVAPHYNWGYMDVVGACFITHPMLNGPRWQKGIGFTNLPWPSLKSRN